MSDTGTETAIRDSKGRWLKPPPGNRAITSDTAREMVRLREEKRHRLYAEGAQRAVQDKKLIAEYGDDAHLVERAMTLQIIASTPDAGKAAVMADTALQRAQGYDVKPEQQVAQQRTQPDVVLALLALVDGGDNYNYRKQDEDVIDVEADDAGVGG